MTRSTRQPATSRQPRSLRRETGRSWAAAAPIVAPAALLLASLFTSSVASAASLEGPMSGWQQGSEPGHMSMYIYVPDNVAQNAPILVLLHFCSGNAGAVFSQAGDGGMVSLADQNGFILLVPQTSNNCWDVGTAPSLTNGGGGDTGAIVHQVEYTVSEYGANPDRVYAVGTSGGGMAAQALLAVYPDVFKGGAEFSGVPAGCWAVNNDVDGQWSGPCANGEVTHSAQEWGDMVRDMYPGYSGFRPRVQLWHGSGDTTISFVNHTEAIKQWINVLGLPEAPTATSNVTVNGAMFTRDEWKDDCDTTVLDVFTEPNGPHNTSANMRGQYSMPFLGLDVVGDVDPQVAAGCGGPSDDMPTDDMATDDMPTDDMATDDMGGMGGMPDDGSDPATGGMGGAGGMPDNGGTPMTGGMGGAGGTPDNGGAPGTDGMTAAGGGGNDPAIGGTTTPDTGSAPTGTATGGAATTPPGSTPAMGTGGTGMPPTTTDTGMSTGTSGTATAGAPSAAGTDMMPAGSGSESEGTGCVVNGRNPSRPLNALALAGFFVAMCARRRLKRSA